MDTPYARHLSAADPAAFARGFARAADWKRRHPRTATHVHQVIATSTNRPWKVSATLLGMAPTAETEGLALGVYGLVALERLP